MEAIGIAIGVPGLAALFLKAGLQGYEVLTNAKGTYADVDHYIHSIKLEQQKLQDWRDNINRVKLSDDPNAPERERYLLIIGTLARIACLFTSMAAVEDEYVPTVERVENKNSVRRLLRSFRRLRIETPQRSSSPANSRYRMEEILPHNMISDKLEVLGKKVEKSDISTQSIKWALLDRKKLQELLERLSGYTQSLIDISRPLLSASASRSTERQFMVPFPHNPNYVERKDVHGQLDELLTPKNDIQPRAALWALGGMGKTTIAVEYCYRCWRKRSATSIFWVHANSEETFQASYQDIAKRIGIKGLDEDQCALQDAVKHWLESSESGEWILVIDNLDNLEIETKYIPIRQGTILFTTRDRRIRGDPRFAVPKNAMIEVQKMNLAEASLMCKTLGMADDSDPAQSSAQIELLELLEYLPLAIAQSAAYIRNTSMTTQQYTELFKESVDNQAILLDKPLYRSSKEDCNSSESRTVMRTWAITIDKIKTENPLALEILQFMSVMDPEKISLKLIHAVPHFEEAGNLILSEAIGLLLSFALLTLLESSDYHLHRLVSFWSRATMRREQRNNILHVAAESLQRSFPEDMVAHLPTCSQLLPHTTTLLQHIQASDIEFDEIMVLQGFIAAAFNVMGEYDKALEWYQRALGGKEKTFGKDHPETLATVHDMAGVFGAQGEYDKALGWYQRALDGREKTLGKDHPDTLGTVNNMAGVFDSQGAYDKALKWYQRALDGKAKTLGKDHPSTLGTVNNIALVFDNQGEYDKALEWYQWALDCKAKTLGKDHPDTLGTVHNMAGVFGTQGEYDKALEWYQRALDGKEKTLGKDHPSTLDTVHNMAGVFVNQGAYDKALEWYQRALDGCEKTLGKDHPETLATVNNMALVFDNQGAYDKALEWYQRALDGKEKTLGKDHPSTLVTVHNMALVFGTQGAYDKALEWYQRALDGCEKTLGKDHPSTLDTVHSMAEVFKSQGAYDKALEWYQRALEGKAKTLGKYHPSTMATVNDMASILRIRSWFPNTTAIKS